MSDKSSILVVDDERFNINVVVSLLKDDYKMLVAKSGEKALEIATSDKAPDLILLDIMMPGMDGYDVCRQLKADKKSSDIPVIFLTAKSEVDDEAYGFDVGAADYITKPFSAPIVKARVKTHLALHQAQQALANQNVILEKKVAERTKELVRIQDAAIYSMASLAETRDNETGYHLRRTQHYIKALAEHLRDHPKFCDELNDETIDLIFRSAPLHDIGKVGVPDRILLKPDKLSGEEWKEMKKHAEYGYEAIVRAEKQLGTTSFLRYARDIAHSHHEKWDGTGYPDGLANKDISLAGRLMALADVYDALVCRRVYKEAIPHEKAAQIILEGRGTHFDPDIVDAFLELQDEFVAIADKYSDASVKKEKFESEMA